MATITLRGPFQWQAKVRRRGYKIQTKTFTHKAEAERWARSIEADMDRGGFISPALAERTLFRQLAERFSADFAPHHYRGPAWKSKLAHLIEHLGDYSLIAITPTLVAQYRDERLQAPDPRYRDPSSAPRISPATVKSELDMLSKVLDVATKEFGISLPFNAVAGVRKPSGGCARDRRLSAEERARLLEEAGRSRNRHLLPIVRLALETAMRQGEILNLRWEYIDLRHCVALLPFTKNGQERAVPLTSEAIAVLQTLPRSIKGVVFPVDRMALFKAFEGAAKRAGIHDLRFHDLRHESLSTLAELGDLNVLELAAVSGHKTLQVLKRYTHLHAGKLAERINAARRAASGEP